MEDILNYIRLNKEFFSLIGMVTFVYYAIFILVYGIPINPKIKKNKKNKIFNIKDKHSKNFNIFDKNINNPSDDGKLINTSKNEDWLDAFEALEEQSLIIENDIEINDILDDQGISPSKKED